MGTHKRASNEIYEFIYLLALAAPVQTEKILPEMDRGEATWGNYPRSASPRLVGLRIFLSLIPL